MSSVSSGLAGRFSPRRPLVALAVVSLGLSGLAGVALAPGASGATAPTIYVTNGGNSTVTEYPEGTTGNSYSSVVPLSGPALHAPTGIAVAPSGDLFVANFATNSIVEYAPGASGSAAPIATIHGTNTGFGTANGLEAIAVAFGRLYVVNASNTSQSVSEFDLSQITPGTDNLAPVATISGSNTDLSTKTSPFGIALDPAGDIFVSLLDNTVVEFAAGAQGNVAPVATLSGPATALDQPGGLVIGFSTLYVANADNVITEYPLPSIASGANDLAPGTTISGPATGLDNPAGIALDSSGDLYVANEASPASITEYGPTANANAAPLADITGSHTGLSGPNFVALTPSPPPSSTLAVTTPPLPGAPVNAHYAKALSATGGKAPYTWSIARAPCPPDWPWTRPPGSSRAHPPSRGPRRSPSR